MNTKIKVAINGLGRIGRSIFKLLLKEEDILLVGINEINPDYGNWVYTLNYDSIYGKLENKVSFSGNKIFVGKKSFYTSNSNSLLDIPFLEWGVDILIDCTGVKENINNAKKALKNNQIKKVLFTHSQEELDFYMILGVNEEEYNPTNHNLISSSICDATAIAPVTKLINDLYKIKMGYVTTLHPWLSYQNLMDGPSSSWSVPGTVYHHYALGRSAIGNMIPKPTSAMEAVFKVISNLNSNQIGSFSYRTPTQLVGSADITYFVDKNVSKSAFLESLNEFESKQKYPIIKLSDEPLVSSDYMGEEFSCILDKRWLDVIDNQLIKIVLWYDNEYGYCSNVIRQIKYISQYL